MSAERILRVLAVLAGFGQFWISKYIITSDGISYLEIASNYSHGRWQLAANSYWSPLFSWILAIGDFCLRPSPAFSVALLHAVNLAAYIVALCAFELFFRQLTTLIEARSGAVIPEPLWKIAGYCAFMWASLGSRQIFFPAPDMIVTAFVYFALGILLKINSGDNRRLTFALFGLVLALSYLAKAAMLPMAPVFLLAAGVAVRPWSISAARVGLSIAVFLAIIAPFLALLHQAKGYWTFGEAGSLNYAWEVNKITKYMHWQGEPGNVGIPVHPTRKLLDHPAVYEFGEPLRVTYAPWYDPSYWFQGITPRFNIAQQAQIFWENCLRFLQFALALPVLLGLALARVLARRSIRGAWHGIMPPVITSLLAIGLYSCVFIDFRYVAAFVVVAGLSAVSIILVGAGLSPFSKRMIATAVIMACCYFVLPLSAGGLLVFIRDGLKGSEEFPNTEASVANEASQFGLRAGDRIAYIGAAINADWARLDGLRIVAEISVKYNVNDASGQTTSNRDTTEVESFWKADLGRQQLVFDLFRNAGARFVVADCVPEWASTVGWTKLRTQRPQRTGTPFVYLRKIGD
jgi:hypothetical protein